MQTEQPVVARVHVPLFTAEDVAKKRVKRSKDEIPNEVIAQALEIWVQLRGWAKPIPTDALIGTGLTPFALGQLVYRYGYTKRMLPPEQWVPGWGRRPRKAGKGLEAPKEDKAAEWSTAALSERFRRLDARVDLVAEAGSPETTSRIDELNHRVDEWVEARGVVTLQVEHLGKEVKGIHSSNKQLADVLEDMRRMATPASQLNEEIMRLAGIIEHEKVGSISLLERVVKIENKLRGGGRRSPILLTRMHREIRRRLRILLSGGK